MHNLAAQTYGQTAKQTVSPRALEADLLMKAAAQLQAVRDNWNEGHSDFHAALLYNRKLWQVIVTSAVKAENPLPDAIKQNIANLGVFVFKQTLDAQTGHKPEKLAPLISINREIAAGLRSAA